MGHFLSVRNWEPIFVPTNTKIQATSIWIWLPQLSTEFYNKEILVNVGKRIGKFLKIDMPMSATLKGRYTRMCIEVPIEVPLQIPKIIGHYKRPIVYESEGISAKSVGLLAISQQKIPLKIIAGTPEQQKLTISSSSE